MLAFAVQKKRPPLVTQIEQVIFSMLLAAVFSLFVMQGYDVSGKCMQPHLFTGERVLAYKLAYAIDSPRRGDVVIFQYPRDPSETFVKRVIGLPGDMIAIRDGQVFLNGKLFPEPYRVNAMHGTMAPQLVPHDSYFVMGDNRDQSDDSRFWGDLPRRDLIGRAVACYWPLDQAHVLRASAYRVQ